MRHLLHIVILLLLLPTAVMAQDDYGGGTLWGWFKQWREHELTSDMDSGYIAIPERPWLVSINLDGGGNLHGFNIPEINIPGLNDVGRGSAVFRNGFYGKLSAGAYYRGWGLSYGRSISNPNSSQFTFTSYGQTLGIDLNIQRSSGMECEISVHDAANLPIYDEVLDASNGNGQFSLININAYYVFNSRRFSYGAALGQSSMQMHDAGSFFLGMTYYHTALDFSGSQLATYMNANRCEITTRQLAIGMGYGYNHVSSDKRFLLHGSVMPMLLVPVYNSFHMTPLDTSDPQSLAYYTARHEDLEYYSYRTQISLLGVVRVALYWNISPVWVLGITTLATAYPSFVRDRVSSFSLNESVFAYVGYRF
ncbi:MAG: DUF4421 family protein [Bacteroidales bacterium]|nr:DUF4421 family protein [Bacteroidales bacterium]